MKEITKITIFDFDGTFLDLDKERDIYNKIRLWKQNLVTFIK